MHKVTAGHDSPRYISLDIIRGFAVMGILAMNIIAFSMPEMAYISPAIYGGDSMADLVSWALSAIFFEGKMRGLFSVLFGASLLLVVHRAEERGHNGAAVHYARMFWLAIIGLVHYFFIWTGDILFLYAATGAIAYFFRNLNAGQLIRWALLFYFVGFILYSVSLGEFLYLQWAANQPGASPAIEQDLAEIMADPYLDIGGHVQSQLALYSGGYGGILAAHFSNWVAPFNLVLDSFFETLPLMMIGMAMLKNGFLTGDWEMPVYRKYFIWLFCVGIGFNILLVILAFQTEFDLVTMLNISLAWSLISRLILTLAYAALLMLLIGHFARHSFFIRVAAAGRAAFTNYLGTSILMVPIFYGYGLGQFGEYSRSQLWLFVISGWMIMLIWSRPWLKKFQYGPMEWLWRSLARSEIQPMRKLRD